MVEVRPGSRKHAVRVGAALLVLLMAGCATHDGLDFGPDRARHRELMAAQRARRDLAAQSPTPTTVDEKLHEGDQLRRSGAPARALFRYLEAHRLDPTDPTARERIAYVHLEEDPDRARAIFEDVLVENPGSANAHLGLGLAQLSLGHLDLARGSLETAHGLSPDSPEILSALGSVYDRLGLHEQARAQLERARTLRPHDARILNNLGVAYLVAGEARRAEEPLRQSVLLDPHDPAARNNLGLALCLQQRFEDAVASFREAGAEQAAQNNLGYCYFLNERYAEAIEHYEKALMAEGDQDLTVLRNLAGAREAQREGHQRHAPRPESPEASPAADEPASEPAAAEQEETEPRPDVADEPELGPSEVVGEPAPPEAGEDPKEVVGRSPAGETREEPVAGPLTQEAGAQPQGPQPPDAPPASAP